MLTAFVLRRVMHSAKMLMRVVGGMCEQAMKEIMKEIMKSGVVVE